MISEAEYHALMDEFWDIVFVRWQISLTEAGSARVAELADILEEYERKHYPLDKP